MYRDSLLIAIGISLITQVCWADPQADLYERIDASVVCIESLRSDTDDRVLGSGFFVTPDTIVTAFHLIQDAETVHVYLSDTAKHPATLLASDTMNDVAILRGIGLTSSNYLSMKPSKPELGEAVFTVGCPFGLEHSLTQGVVSHADREIEGHRLIQVDLSVNYGNSGGPLVNHKGQLLGTIYGYLLEGHGGINFAIPIDETLSVIQRHGPIAKSVQDAEHLFLLWQQATTEDDPQQKIHLYSTLVERAPWMTRAYYNRAIVYHKLEDYVAAIAGYDQVILDRPKYYQAYANRGLAYYRLGKHPQARDSLINAIGINPDYAPAFLNLGLVYARGLGDHQSGERAFKRFLQLVPEGGEALEVTHWLSEYENNGIFEFEETVP